MSFQLWGPIFKRHRVKMHRECPLHVARDVLGLQEAAKRFYRNDLWVCAICGKPFVAHVFLDMHMYNAHNNVRYSGDDAVCLADYCDIFRCQAYLPPPSSDDNNDDDDDENSIDDVVTHRSLYPSLGVLKPHAHNSASAAGGEVALAPAPPPELLHMLNVLGSQKAAIDQLDDLRSQQNNNNGLSEFEDRDYDDAFLGTRPRRGQDYATTKQEGRSVTAGATRKDTRPREEGRMASLESMLWSVLGKVKERAATKVKAEGGGGGGQRKKEGPKIVERWRQPEGQEQCDREKVAKVRKKCEALVDGCISYHAGEGDQLYEKLKGSIIRCYMYKMLI